LILYSTLVIWSLVFLTGLGTCGIEAGYFNQSTGTATYAGVFALVQPTRGVPYVFGYMMAAKVGTGIVAELGAMRISEEIDALEVMGVNSMTFLCATRLLAAWIVLPFMYIGAIGVAYLGSYIAIVHQLGFVSSGGYFLIFWPVPERAGPVVQRDQGMTMATVIVLVAATTATTPQADRWVVAGNGKSMVLNLVLVNLIGMFRNAGVLGRQSTRPDRRLTPAPEVLRRRGQRTVLGSKPLAAAMPPHPPATLTAMSKTLVIAEKPPSGRISRACSRAPSRKARVAGRAGACHHVAVGHLVQLAEPDEYDPKLKRWRMDDLPIVPEHFKLVVRDERSRKQMSVVTKQIGRDDVADVVNACDAGREGELIFAVPLREGQGQEAGQAAVAELDDERCHEGGLHGAAPGGGVRAAGAGGASRSEAD